MRVRKVARKQQYLQASGNLNFNVCLAALPGLQ